MLSLGPFRYRNVYLERGGPILRTEAAGSLPVLSRSEFQVNAYLEPTLAARKPGRSVYGVCDGTGSSSDPIAAQHKAISEALERWALLVTQGSPLGNRYGFHYDRSSNGMAAFPGFKFQACRAAREEALERWALIGWWAGHFDSEQSVVQGHADIKVIRLLHGRAQEVVVIYRQAPAGFTAYGHAAGKNLRTAVHRAAVELARNEVVIAQHKAKAVLAPVTNFLERRALYFASAEGRAVFDERLARKADKPSPPWKTIFDGEIPGPWSKYATVWRCCVEMPTLDFLDRDKNFFYW